MLNYSNAYQAGLISGVLVAMNGPQRASRSPMINPLQAFHGGLHKSEYVEGEGDDAPSSAQNSLALGLRVPFGVRWRLTEVPLSSQAVTQSQLEYSSNQISLPWQRARELSLRCVHLHIHIWHCSTEGTVRYIYISES
ncbi:hypothetical protein QAD02_016856 [Eretmocerus hayati]|uniref:Uncharacterized protein n=1 Tax=Eretmocerus hayati TaxID=131215 RepID=A0ACC2PBS5_9HYME|nr:hypothetical protein QAD02_016856 [Eretmocerus hayati]